MFCILEKVWVLKEDQAGLVKLIQIPPLLYWNRYNPAKEEFAIMRILFPIQAGFGFAVSVTVGIGFTTTVIVVLVAQVEVPVGENV